MEEGELPKMSVIYPQGIETDNPFPMGEPFNHSGCVHSGGKISPKMGIKANCSSQIVYLYPCLNHPLDCQSEWRIWYLNIENLSFLRLSNAMCWCMHIEQPIVKRLGHSGDSERAEPHLMSPRPRFSLPFCFPCNSAWLCLWSLIGKKMSLMKWDVYTLSDVPDF